MTDPHNSAPDGEFIKIVYRQIMADDWDKFRAKSNISDTGGGARDLRFRKQAAAALKTFFPSATLIERRKTREGVRRATPISTGKFYWEDGAAGQSSLISFEAPTPSRPGEMRLSRVYRYPFFKSLTKPAISQGAAYLLFALKRNGEIWAYMVTNTQLDHPDWHPAVRAQIRKCAEATRASAAVSGVIDLLDNTKSSCNADA